MFKMGVITDEISSNLSKAVEVAKDLNLECVELRGIWGKNVKDLTDSDVGKIRNLVQAADMEVACIASPFFKCHITNDEEIREHLQFLPRLVEIAKSLDTNLVRIFAFWRAGTLEQYWSQVIERLREAVDICSSEGVILALENEHATLIGTGLEVRRIVETINSRSLRITWDPGNAFCAGEIPYPNGYREARAHMVHMHVKDALLDASTKKCRFVTVGKGEIDYERQFRALLDDQYEGCVSIETHYQLPGDEGKSTRETFEGICKILRKLDVAI